MSQYQVIAPVYKKLMSHVDYSMWASYLLETLAKHDHTPAKALEMAGGTGDLAEHLNLKIPQLIGSDLNLRMTDQMKPEFFQHRLCLDMTAIPFQDGYFDTLFALYDSVNYLTEWDELESFFESSARVLSRDGLLVFDTVTELNSVKYFEDALDFEEYTEGDLVREAWYDHENQLQFTRFIYYKEDNGVFHKTEEEHIQKIWHEGEVRELAESLGFEVLARYDGFSHDDMSSDSERIHWVLKKL